jgi:putative mRNA 3-end processing factor
MGMSLITFTSKGLYCPQGDFYIDPWRPVNKALITHGHADHARWGHQHYLAHHEALPVMKYRLGDIQSQGIEYNEVLNIHGLEVSFHPAGHIIGSSQIRIADSKEIWVISGDYKVAADGLTTPFEPVVCDHFVTESTFGLPVFNWLPQEKIMAEINDWWIKNAEVNRASILVAYSLGKAQRLLKNLNAEHGPIFCHDTIYNTTKIIENQGYVFPNFQKIQEAPDKKTLQKSIIICTPASMGGTWLRKLNPYSVGIASGWMHLRGTKNRRAADKGFVLSDHADWPGLNEAVKATGAQNIYVTHGYKDVFSRYLLEKGLHAQPLETAFTGEVLDTKEADD